MVRTYRARAHSNYLVEAKQYTGYEQKIFDMPIVDGRLGNTIHILKMNHWVVKDCHRNDDGSPRYIVYYPDQFTTAFELVPENEQSPSASL